MRWAILPISFSLISTRRRHYSISRELSLSQRILSLLHTLPLSSLERSLDHFSSSSLLTPHVVSSVLSQSPPFPSSFRFFVWASNFKRLRSWHSLELMISTLQSNHSILDSAWDFLLDIKNSQRPISPQAFIVLVRAYFELGFTEKAIEAFTRMHEFGSKPDTFAFNTVIDILVKKDAIFLGMGVYNQMVKVNCQPNRATFGILIDGFCKGGMIGDARKLFDEMERLGIRPNAMMYTLILSALCGKSGKVQDAEVLFDSMRMNGCRPDSVVYGVMLSGYCKSGRIDEAFERLKAFEEEGYVLGLNGYSSLIDGLFRAKRFEAACKLYKEMIEKNVDPDCVLYTIMIRGYSEAGKVEEAMNFLTEMTERGVVPDTYCYNTLIKGLCDMGRLDRARSLSLEISQHDLFPDSTTFTILICGLCKEGLVLEAREIFDEMGKLGCVPSVYTFNSLISGLCKAGKLQDATSMFDKMKIKPSLFLRLFQGVNNRVRDTDSLRKMVEELCEAGFVVKAYKLLRDIIDVVVPDVVTYNVLINGLFKCGKPDEALKLFKELQIMGQSPDEVTLATLIDGLLKVHREEDAWVVYQHLLKNKCSLSLSICNTVMRMLCRKRKVSQAVNLWFTHISQRSTCEKEAETIKATRNHFEQGNLEESVKRLIEMDRARGSVSSSPYTIWLIGFCQAWQADDALKIFNILTEFDVDVTPPSCVLLVHSLCWEGKLATALDVMLYALRKGFSLGQPVGNRLLKKLCMDNKKKEAHELVWRMSLAGYDMDAYLRVSTKHMLYNQKTAES